MTNSPPSPADKTPPSTMTESGTPSPRNWVQECCGKTPQKKSERIGGITMSQADFAKIAALVATSEFNALAKFNHLVALGSLHETTTPGSVNLTSASALSVALKNALSEVQQFVDLQTRKGIGTQEIALASDELPTAWRDTFPRVREKVLETIGRDDPELATLVQAPRRLAYLMNSLHSLPDEAPVDSIELLHHLNAVEKSLKNALPSLRQLANTTRPLINIMPEEQKLLSPASVKFLGKMALDSNATLPPGEGLDKLEALTEQVSMPKPKPGNMRVRCDAIPEIGEIEPFYQATRDAMIKKLVTEQSGVPQELIEDNTLSPQTIASIIVANDGFDASLQRNAETILPPSRFLPLIYKIPGINNCEHKNLKTMLANCGWLDAHFEEWKTALTNIHERIETASPVWSR